MWRSVPLAGFLAVGMVELNGSVGRRMVECLEDFSEQVGGYHGEDGIKEGSNRGGAPIIF
jgi:hypothetical protein